MTTVNYSVVRPNIGTGALHTWAGMAAGDDGQPAEEFNHADRTVQVIGNFGGATVSMQGSNDGSNWFDLTNAQGLAIAFTSTGGKIITECPRYIRPLVTGGAGVAVTIMVFGRKGG